MRPGASDAIEIIKTMDKEKENDLSSRVAKAISQNDMTQTFLNKVSGEYMNKGNQNPNFNNDDKVPLIKGEVIKL